MTKCLSCGKSIPSGVTRLSCFGKSLKKSKRATKEHKKLDERERKKKGDKK